MKLFFKNHPVISALLAAVCAASLALLGGLIVPTTRIQIRHQVEVTMAHLSPAANNAFPEVSDLHLTPLQRKIVAISREEYAKRPVSYDQSVLAYTQRTKESWCADYATWVLWQAGAPLSNPNSGSWRIPGVLTLQTYYKSIDKYKPIGTYTPKTGDVAIYTGNTTLDGRSHQHTSIVLKVDKNTMTTIGGNENGRMRVSTQSYTTNQNSLVGFGVL